jgi:protein-S-isoprenylcysteine O-methyltransferase Ste14
MDALKHARAIILLPVMVTIIIPSVLIYLTDHINVSWYLWAGYPYLPAIIGFCFIGLGLFLLIRTNALFATVGKGTLAPWDPPQKLVVRGIYRRVRNPMISGVFCVLCGESLIVGSPWLFGWFVLFMIVNLVYIPFIEEVDLECRLGEEYVVYKKNVPRWIPRLSPWNPSFTVNKDFDG